MDSINKILSKFNDVRVLLLGDIMLDKYVYGDIKRISPEAPIQILCHRTEETMLGGAGNVFRNLIALSGDQHILISVVGNDEYQIQIKKILNNTAKYHLFIDPERKTTLKMRFIAQKQQILRYDNETITPISEKIQQEVLNEYCNDLKFVDVVALSDYNKGFFTKNFILEIIRLAKNAGKMVLVDPKGRDYSIYAGADFVKPNRKELTEAIDQPIFTINDMISASRSLCQKYSLGNIIVTLGEEGMLYVPGDRGKAVHINAEYAPEVFDVTGAGDTVFSVLALSLAAGTPVPIAMHVSNVAAQIAISKSGTTTVTSKEIIQNINIRTLEAFNDNLLNKIVSLSQAKKIIQLWKNNGDTVCFTNGCFDLLHYGHISSFLQTKKHGDRLVVALNSDMSVKKYKGTQRPIQDEKTRASLLAVLQCIDLVIIFDDDTALPLVQELHPDVIAKEGYALEKWPEARFVQSYGGKVVFLKREIDYSTTGLVNKIIKLQEPGE